MKNEINDLIQSWRNELENLRDWLWQHGEKGESLEYNIKSAEALRLSICISDLLELKNEITA